MSGDASVVHRVVLRLPSAGPSLRSLSSRALGHYGETLAVRYLERNGYEIVDRNVTLERGEIDIWATKDETLVFVEVKTRRGVLTGEPLEAIDPKKRDQLLRVIGCGLMFMSLSMDMRLDVIGIHVESEARAVLTHMENVELV